MATTLRLVIATAIVAAACGSRGGSPPPTAPGPAGSSADAPAATETTPAPAPDAPLSDDECARLVNHIIDIGLDVQRRTRRPEEVPTEEQVAKIRAELVPKMRTQCAHFSRASWQCAM